MFPSEYIPHKRAEAHGRSLNGLGDRVEFLVTAGESMPLDAGSVLEPEPNRNSLQPKVRPWTTTSAPGW